MGSCFPQDRLTGVVLEKHLSVKAAAETFGHNGQYLRRLLRAGWLEGVKVGQVWLIKLASLEGHLCKGQMAQDRRYGPQSAAAGAGEGVTA